MRKDRRILMVVVFLSWVLASVAIGAETPAGRTVLALPACIDLAIKNDPEARYALDQVQVGQLTVKEAKQALWLPTINMESTRGPKLDFFGRPVESDNIYFSKVSMEKPLYEGGGLMASYRLGEKAIERARYDYLQKRAEVTMGTVDAYYKLLLAQEKVQYLQKLHDRADRTVTILNGKFLLGAVVRVDLLEAKSRRADIKYRLIKGRGDLREAMAVLNGKIGHDPRDPVRVVREFPIAPLEGDTERFVALALKQRPDLLYDRGDAEFSALRVKLQKSKSLPKVSLVGSYSWEGNDFPGEDKEWAVSLNLTFSLWDGTLQSSLSRNQLLENSFNFVGREQEFDSKRLRLSLFDGSSNEATLERARAAYRLAKDRLAQEKRTIEREVRDAVNRLQEADALMEATHISLGYKKEKLRLLEEKWRLRDVAELDLLDARMKLAQTQLDHFQALYQRSSALARLYEVTGTPLKWKENGK